MDTRWGFVEDVRQADQLERLGLELDAQDQRRFGEAFCKFHKVGHWLSVDAAAQSALLGLWL